MLQDQIIGGNKDNGNPSSERRSQWTDWQKTPGLKWHQRPLIPTSTADRYYLSHPSDLSHSDRGGDVGNTISFSLNFLDMEGCSSA